MKTGGVTGMLMATAVALTLTGGKASGNPDQTRQAPGRDETPQTAEEHFARAAFFRGKADSYRAEAETHRNTIARREQTRAHPIHKTTSRRKAPWIPRMRARHARYIEAAELFAAEADRIADFHEMRGEEMRGE